MSLRTDYTGTLDTKLAEARAAGLSFVTVDNLADITTQMAAQANKGVKSFTLTFTVTYQPEDLKLLGPLWSAFQSGVLQGLHSEDIMANEVAVSLNTSDTVTTRVDLAFTF
jgi:hypothetical protein